MIVNRLADLLAARQMPLAELQRQTGLTYANLHAFTRGHSKQVSFTTLDRICSALDVGVGELLEHVPD